MQVQHLQQNLQSSQQQEAILRTELQHRCDKVEDLTKDHNALLTRFRELTVLMSEAHNKLNTAVVQSGKAMAKDHSKVNEHTCSQTNRHVHNSRNSHSVECLATAEVAVIATHRAHFLLVFLPQLLSTIQHISAVLSLSHVSTITAFCHALLHAAKL